MYDHRSSAPGIIREWHEEGVIGSPSRVHHATHSLWVTLHCIPPCTNVRCVLNVIVWGRHLRKSVALKKSKARIHVAAIPINDRNRRWYLIPIASEIAVHQIIIIVSVVK